MEVEMLWLGLLLAAIGGLLLYLARRAAARAHHMRATETSRVGDLLETVRQVRAELGGGPSELREYVELKGTVQCPQPLTAELSGQPAAVVQTRITRDLEVERHDRDQNGHTVVRRERRSETVHQQRLEAPFLIDDGSGTVEVRPAGAELTLQAVVDRFEAPAAVEQGGGLRWGGRAFGLQAGVSLGLQPASRVIGYRFHEAILPVGARVYLLGELSDTGDGLSLHKPAGGDRPFVVSVKAEEELVASAQSSEKWMKIGGIVLIVGGAVAAVAGLF
jgi:hypothetical protein